MVSAVLNSLSGDSSLIVGKLTLEQKLVGRVRSSDEIESDDKRRNDGAIAPNTDDDGSCGHIIISVIFNPFRATEWSAAIKDTGLGLPRPFIAVQ